MPTPFLSSEEYDERAHLLYNEGQFDEALDVLREGLNLYPHSVELHVGIGYARLAREEYAWARRSFEEALVLDGEHEDALAGFGETLLRFGQRDAALKSFRKILELGYQDDLELMLQVGRALFRDELLEEARRYFEIVLQQAPDSAEAVALVGYVQHRAADDEGAVASLRRALQLDNDNTEARIYLANILYDRGECEAALYHLDRTTPEDHWDELGIWRLQELKKSIYRLRDDDPELRPWDERLAELAGPPNDIDEMLAEIEQRMSEGDQDEARTQLELFGTLLADFADQRTGPGSATSEHHRVIVAGQRLEGSWTEIVRKMRDTTAPGDRRPLQDYMEEEARRVFSRSGKEIPTDDAESFIRASADAGLLRIIR